MSNRFRLLLVVLLTVADIALGWRIISGGDANASRSSVFTETPLTLVDGEYLDLRGLYAYPKLGKFTFPLDSTKSARPSMSVLVYMQAEVVVGASKHTQRMLKSLAPILHSRGQRLAIASSAADSAAVISELMKVELMMPVLSVDTIVSGMDVEQAGISDRAKPFVIVYDSTMTAVYVQRRVASKVDCERLKSMLTKLSKLYAERSATRPDFVEGSRPPFEAGKAGQ